MLCFFFHSHSRIFLRMIASDTRSRIVGMDFFSFPSRSRILAIDLFIPFPFPNLGNVFFSFPSRSQIFGMGFFHSLPVPELREWNYPFPNSKKSFPLTPGQFRTIFDVKLPEVVDAFRRTSLVRLPGG